MGSDREAGAFGYVRQRGIGYYARDPSVDPSGDGCAKADPPGDVTQQILERPPGLAGFVDFRIGGGNVRRQHGAKRRVFTDNRVDPELRDRADKLTEEFDVLGRGPRPSRGRTNEEMRQPGALNDEELGVQLCEEGLVRVPVGVIQREAHRWINLVDIQVFERVRRESIELLATRDEHSRLADPRPEDTPKRAGADVW